MTDFLWLKLTLKSEATFGRGEGVAGLVDEEVEHDQYGLPFLRGRTLKGLLVEECANLLPFLPPKTNWAGCANRLFGETSSDFQQDGLVYFGDARLPAKLHQAVRYQYQQKKLTRTDVLESLTDIRRQTAMDVTGRPETGSLRSLRVILRETPFEAKLQFSQELSQVDLALLSACVLAFRRAGTGRNRGQGHLVAQLQNEQREDVTPTYFAHFQKEILV